MRPSKRFFPYGSHLSKPTFGTPSKRMTRIERATPTLARLCSTTELHPPTSSVSSYSFSLEKEKVKKYAFQTFVWSMQVEEVCILFVALAPGYLSRGSPLKYSCLLVVSPSSSGWIGVGPARQGHQEQCEGASSLSLFFWKRKRKEASSVVFRSNSIDLLEWLGSSLTRSTPATYQTACLAVI